MNKYCEKFKVIVEQHGYKLISEYIGANNKVILKCPNDHEYEVQPKHFVHSGSRCGLCKKKPLNKIDEFVKRNEYRNKHLWDNGLVEGIDYITCPVSNSRLSMIKRSYIEQVLDMTVEEYDILYPNVRGVCKNRIKNIKRGLKSVDSDTGLTKHEISVIKSRESLSKVGDDGLTGDERRAIKTKQSNLNNIDDRGMNGYERTAEKARPKQIETLRRQGKISRCGGKSEWEIYKKFVHFLTNRNRKYITIPNGVELGRKKGQYSLDHKYTVCSGYNNRISPFVLSLCENLEYILHEKNISKSTNNSIGLCDLYDTTLYTENRSEIEFVIWEKVVKVYVENDECFSMVDLNADIVNEL